MTLKEKFDCISCKDCDMPYCDTKCTMLSEYELNKLEQIADEFAIEFGEYLDSLTVENIGDLSIKQLLEIFKKEEGL